MPFAVMLVALVLGVLVAVPVSLAGAGTETVGAIASAVSAAAIMAGAFLLRSRLPSHERVNVTRSKLPIVGAIAAGVGFGLAFRLGIGIITALGQQIDPGLCQEMKDATDIVPPELWQKIVLTFVLVIFAPFGEELLFRGIVLRGFVRVMRFAPAAIISGVLFGLAHPQYYVAWPFLVGMCLFGVLAGVIYRAFGYPTVVAMHLTFNAIAAVFLFMDVDVSEMECPTP